VKSNQLRVIFSKHELDTTSGVLEMRKGVLPHWSAQNEAACGENFWGLSGFSFMASANFYASILF
jgi:hypothetical protein